MSCEYCLIGHPVGHSISTEIHRRLFEFSGRDAGYSTLDIEPESLESRIPELRQLSGFNITIPFKQKLFPYFSFVYGAAGRYGAVNTVRCEDGKMYGYNTDADGFLQTLEAAKIPLAGNVLLCGAGGVAHMMACEALDRGCRLTVATRTIGKAQALLSELRRMYPDAEIEVSSLRYLSGSFDLILNGTPSGMYPDKNSCPVPAQVARSAKAVFDAVYNPLETKLLRTASRAGARTLNGLPMLVRQAAAAHGIWLGDTFTEEQISALCAEMEQLLQENF